jgi:hypothetical protein
VTWPNPRLQRTPLRAPLSRKPLGAPALSLNAFGETSVNAHDVVHTLRRRRTAALLVGTALLAVGGYLSAPSTSTT